MVPTPEETTVEQLVPTVQETTVNKPTKQADLSEVELDEVAKKRLSVHTDYQTRWAVWVFKGKKKCNKNVIIM